MPQSKTLEAGIQLIGSCLLDNGLIDKAISAGITELHFAEQWQSSMWGKLVKMRATGGVADAQSLALDGVPYADIIRVSDHSITCLHFKKSLESLLWHYSFAKIKSLAQSIVIEQDGEDARKNIANSVQQMQAWTCDHKDTARSCEEIGAEVETWITDLIDGKPDNRIAIEWPLPEMNERFGPIMPHELCCLGARPKHCKTSTALQTIGHNLRLGRKIAYFTMETSDSATLKMMASQMARVDLRNITKEPKDKQQLFLKYVKKLRAAKNLAIFEKDMSISKIEARCRLLKASMQPDLIVLDHLHLIQNDFGDKAYEKTTDTVNRLIELRKHMGCAILLCLQLNRGSEHNERVPKASDARDSGAIEAAAHRMVIPYRPPNDFNDQPQTGPDALMRTAFDYYFIQDICRDGPSGAIKVSFHAAHTIFTSKNG